MKRLVTLIMRRVYGVRGAIRPPIGGPLAGRMYPIRFRWWKLISRLYNWTGLPEQWRKSLRDDRITCDTPVRGPEPRS